jgi:DNA-binding NarL/FixJ family response regulator
MRILLADNLPKVRFALRVLLEQQPGLEVVGEATDAQDLLIQVEATAPDLVLLRFSLDLARGLYESTGDRPQRAIGGTSRSPGGRA